MDREIILVTLLCGLCGPLVIAAGLIRGQLRGDAPARRLESRAWRQLWLPVLPAALVGAFLVGWAVQEPEAAEPASGALLAVAAVFAAIWLRALVRAGRAARMSARGAVAATTGLWRPRVTIAPELAERLDERALRAALEHEAAHARHRDPLRLWLAQLATDLQWPSPAARQRFTAWRHALELARDAEACERVDGSDLAAAVIEAAQLTRGTQLAAGVGLVTNDAAFADRIHRLLAAPPEPVVELATEPRRWPLRALLGAAIALAVAAGALCGELVIGRLPGLDG